MKTTDNPNEILDIVDENDRVIGQRPRKECNSNPDLTHRSIFILLYNSKGEILWQKRSPTKDINPGYWVTSVSGHVDSGESYQETAHREIKEELGIDVELEFLGKFLFRYPNENEFSAIFRGHSDGPFKLHPVEVSEVKYLMLEELLKREESGKMQVVKPVHLILDALKLR